MFSIDKIADYWIEKQNNPEKARRTKADMDAQRRLDAYQALEARTEFTDVRLATIGNNLSSTQYTQGLNAPNAISCGYYRDTENTFCPLRLKRLRNLSSDISEDLIDPRTLFEGLATGTLAPNVPLRFPSPLELNINERFQVIFGNSSGGTITNINLVLQHLKNAKAVASFGYQVDDNEIREAINEREFPEQVIMEIPFEFPAAAVGSIANYPDDPNRLPESRAAEEHLLVLGFGCDVNNCFAKITDTAGSYNFSQREILIGGQAHPNTSPLAVYQFLPRPHFLAKGSSLQATLTNGYGALFEDTSVHRIVALCQTL